jgi:folylpolyglutamate synthase/dihydropteroate synthase
MKRSYETKPAGLGQPSLSGASKVTYDTEAINKDIARCALELLRQKKEQHPILQKLSSRPHFVEKGLDAQLPCRFELFRCALSPLTAPSLSIILDMAHNEGGIQALVWRLKHSYPEQRYR